MFFDTPICIWTKEGVIQVNDNLAAHNFYQAALKEKKDPEVAAKFTLKRGLATIH